MSKELSSTYHHFRQKALLLINDPIYNVSWASKAPDDWTYEEHKNYEEFVYTESMCKEHDKWIEHNNWTMINYNNGLRDFPEFNQVVLAMIEESGTENCFVDRIYLRNNGENRNPEVSWVLLEWDPETQEEILQQQYDVICWRHLKS